jgi:hypothetical protein
MLRKKIRMKEATRRKQEEEKIFLAMEETKSPALLVHSAYYFFFFFLFDEKYPQPLEPTTAYLAPGGTANDSPCKRVCSGV